MKSQEAEPSSQGPRCFPPQLFQKKAREHVSSCHEHQHHSAGTSLVLSHCRDLNAFALHTVIFYRSFSFSFLLIFFPFLFFPFLFLFSFLFLAPQPKHARQILTQLAPTAKVWGRSSAAIVPNSSLLNFPCIRHKWHVRFEVWQYC